MRMRSIPNFLREAGNEVAGDDLGVIVEHVRGGHRRGAAEWRPAMPAKEIAGRHERHAEKGVRV
jgi:hypothetical protein